MFLSTGFEGCIINYAYRTVRFESGFGKEYVYTHMIKKAVKFYNMTPGLARPAFLNLCSAEHWNSARCEQVFRGKI